jgi:glycine dehydrogenase subunit 1
LTALPSVSAPFLAPAFKEFVVRVEKDRINTVLERARKAGIFAGVSLRRWYPELDDCLLVAVTEKRTRQEIDRLVDCFEED